jgi:hypothetical protein
LISSVYCSDGTTCHVSSSQQTDIGTILEANFGIDSNQKGFSGVLLYKLKRNHTTRIDSQSNSSIVSIENTATNIHLLVIWDVEDYDHRFCACLIECTAGLIWDEDKLCALCSEYNRQFNELCDANVITWLIHDDSLMRMQSDVTYGSGYKLDIIISKGTKKYNMKKPMKIDPNRLVLSLSMLTILMYVVSISASLSVKLNIHNQCLNVDLVSPTYFTGYDLKCHRPPDYKACAGETMRSAFMVCDSQDGSPGVLICELQKKQIHESIEIDKDTSNSVYILIIWKFLSKSNELYADVLLVKHDKGSDWNKDSLILLRRNNMEQFELYAATITET